MRVQLMTCAALLAALMPVAALADDPRDQSMRSAAARARDAEGTRRLNQRELAMVRQRDAAYAQGWRSGGQIADSDVEDHRQAMADYARSRAQYDRDMARWRRAVAACQQGYTSACER